MNKGIHVDQKNGVRPQMWMFFLLLPLPSVVTLGKVLSSQSLHILISKVLVLFLRLDLKFLEPPAQYLARRQN